MNTFFRAVKGLSFICLVLVPSLAWAEGPEEDAAEDSEFLVIGPVEPVPVRKTILDLPPAPGRLNDDPILKTNPRHITFPEALLRPIPDFPLQPDPLLDIQLREPVRADRVFTTPNVNAAGISPSCCPPDTVGEIGPTHFIQMINGVGGAGTTFQAFSRTNGAPAAPAVTLESFATAGSACAAGDGDPIPLFDQLANRWVLTQFQSDAANPFALCLYVSSGQDPVTSTWMMYEFQTPGVDFPDYPKYGVWPTAYFAATNQNPQRVFAMDRTRMLAGQPATMIVRTAPSLAGFGFQIVPPVDLAGATAPPAGAPGIFIRHNDDESHSMTPSPTTDKLEIFEFNPNFTTPANSTFTGPTSVNVAEFSSNLCGLTSFTCIPQPGTMQLLDPLREPVMQRPVYRNFGTHQSLVGSFATNVDAGMGDRAGIRWFELRRNAGTTSGGWSLFQQGTVSSADALSRWMGSLAMDGQGNMALGYSTSGPNAGQFPSLAYTGRQVGDTAGTMPQAETEIIAGTASQTISERWGDYSAMTVDPVDDCTFWFTSEYMPAGNGGFPLTRIASFKFDSCGLTCTADGFEPDNSAGLAKGISSGSPQARNICPADDVDWARFSVTVGCTSPVATHEDQRPGRRHRDDSAQRRPGPDRDG